jgi:hypothetical protein
MNKDLINIKKKQARLEKLELLSKERKRILSISPENAFDAILEHQNPRALVHSFAEEDFYFLVHDIGTEDSLELLSLASNRQWEYILDIENWHKDIINIDAVTHWFTLLQNADPPRFIAWAAIEKPDLIEYYLFKNIEIIMREHDQDPSDFPEDFFTFDDIFYLKISDHPSNFSEDKESYKKRKRLIKNLLQNLADFDHVNFQEMLFRTSNVIPSESEEEAFRLRNFRLAEKGFMPFDDAVGIYQSITIDQLKSKKKIFKATPDPDNLAPVPLNHISMMDDANFFSQALSLITSDDILQQLQIEFAGVCNQLVAADQTAAHNREELKNIVKKAGAYISIAIESLALRHDNNSSKRIEKYVEKYPLSDLFRTGYGLVVNLRQKAKKWQQNGWFTQNRLSLSFWDERLVGLIGGLLVDRPKFYDNYKTGYRYRDFETLKDIEITEIGLNEAMGYDNLLSHMQTFTDTFPKDTFITYKSLLLTLWTRKSLGLEPKLDTIPVNIFKPFFIGLWDTADSPQIKESVKSDFLFWLAAETGISENIISKDLGESLEFLFDEIAENYGTVNTDDLDPRYVQLFLLDF